MLLRFFALQGRCLYIFRRPLYQISKIYAGYASNGRQNDAGKGCVRERTEGFYSGLTLNQYGVASPCRTICTVCGFVALS